MSTQSFFSLIPGAVGGGAVSPSFSVNGSALAPLVEAFDTIAGAGYVREPSALSLDNGRILCNYIGQGQTDSTGRYGALKYTDDFGVTWSAPITAFDLGAANYGGAGGSGADQGGGIAAVQVRNGGASANNVILLCARSPYGPTGLSGATTRLQKYYKVTSTDRGLTWSSSMGTEITSQIVFKSPSLFWFGAGKSITCTATDNGSGKVRITTSAGHGLPTTGSKTVQMILAGWSVGGINGTAYGTIVDATKIDFSTVAFSGSPTGGTVQLVYANVYVPWHGIRLSASSAAPNRLCFAAQLHAACDSTPTAAFYAIYGVLYSDDDGATWSCVVGDESNTTLNGYGCIETSIVEMSTPGKGYITGRHSNTSLVRWESYCTLDASPPTFSAPAEVSALDSQQAPGGLARIGTRYFTTIPYNSRASGGFQDRQRACIYCGSESAGVISWTKPVPLNHGICAYSDLIVDSQGNLHAFWESGDIGDLAGTPPVTNIRYSGKFNAAWLDSQTVANDKVIHAFNERPAGQSCLIQPSCMIQDYSGRQQHGQYFGTPSYAAAPAGGGQTYAVYQVGDFAKLAGVDQPPYCPDSETADSGSFSWEGEIPAHTGFGVVISMSSGVGSSAGAGFGGWNVVTDASGRPVFTIDDGVHHCSLSFNTSVNNGSTNYRLRVVRTAGSTISGSLYNTVTGALLETPTPVADNTTVARGSLTNVTLGVTVGRHPDTTTGRMTAAFGLSLSHFERNANAAMLPMPYVATAPDGWKYEGGLMVPSPTADANDAATILGSHLKGAFLGPNKSFWRGKIGSLTDPLPTSPTALWPISGLLDPSTANVHGNTTVKGAYSNDALVGSCASGIVSSGTSGGLQMAHAAGLYDFIQTTRVGCLVLFFKLHRPSNGALAACFMSTLGNTFAGNGFVLWANTIHDVGVDTYTLQFFTNNATDGNKYDQIDVLKGSVFTLDRWYFLCVNLNGTVGQPMFDYHLADLTTSGSAKSGNTLSPLVTPTKYSGGVNSGNFAAAGSGTAAGALMLFGSPAEFDYEGSMCRIYFGDRALTAAEIKQICNYVG